MNKWVYAGVAAAMICIVGVGTSAAQSNTSNEWRSDASSKAKQSDPVTKTETKTESIAYISSTVEDGSLEYGKTTVRTAGVNGVKTIYYEVTYENDVEVSRTKTKEEVTKQPVNEVIARGTKMVWHCQDTTSYDKNAYNDNYCTSNTGQVQYASDSQAISLDPTYSPGKSGHYYYNSR